MAKSRQEIKAYYHAYYVRHRDKILRRHSSRMKNDPSLRRRKWLRQYGLSIQDWEELFRQQRGRCAICRKSEMTKRLSVDHDHLSGRVRGLLCSRCNRAIGLLGDSWKLTQAATRYLCQKKKK